MVFAISYDRQMQESGGLILAGYVVVGRTARPPRLEPLLPDPYVTVSHCLADDLHVPEFSGWFQDLTEAEAARIESPSSDLLAVGLTPHDADTFMADMSDEDHHFGLLRQEREMPTEAEALGFEIVGAEYALTFHSWHCHGLASEAAATVGIRLNRYGLLADHADAIRVLDWMRALPSAESPAPVPWTAVAIAYMN